MARFDGGPIVLVEDDPNDAYFVRRALEKQHIVNPLVWLHSAKEARDYLARTEAVDMPVIFVLDVHLGAGDTGVELLRWLRKQPSPLGSTPAMMLTASQCLGDREAATGLGCIHFLEKPVTTDAIAEAVQSLGFVISTLGGYSTERILQRRGP